MAAAYVKDGNESDAQQEKHGQTRGHFLTQDHGENEIAWNRKNPYLEIPEAGFLVRNLELC